MQNTKEILEKYKKIALVGASKDLTKTSSVVMKYLQEYGFKVYPVNPSMKGERILGEKVFGSITEIGSPVEIIDVFRPSDEAIEIAKEAVKINAKVKINSFFIFYVFRLIFDLFFFISSNYFIESVNIKFISV